MKFTVITWKDERWSADKEALAGLNKMLRENAKITKRESRVHFWKMHFWKMFKRWVRK